MKNLFLTLAFLTFITFSSWAQVGINNGYNTGYGDFNAGTDGFHVGSTVDNTYSALVINGPNQPHYGAYTRDLVFKFKNAGTSIIRSYRDGSWGTYMQFLTTFYTDGVPLVRMHIDRTGNVGIGREDPAYRLDVNGTIRATEVRVETTGADFVFEDDYELPSLDEVANHIQEKKHLPGIPSAKEMQENGIGVSELNTKLLQKIEELTLYVIKLQTEVDELKGKTDK